MNRAWTCRVPAMFYAAVATVEHHLPQSPELTEMPDQACVMSSDNFSMLFLRHTGLLFVPKAARTIPGQRAQPSKIHPFVDIMLAKVYTDCCGSLFLPEMRCSCVITRAFGRTRNATHSKPSIRPHKSTRCRSK
jgi:hypothetical protein